MIPTVTRVGALVSALVLAAADAFLERCAAWIPLGRRLEPSRRDESEEDGRELAELRGRLRASELQRAALLLVIAQLVDARPEPVPAPSPALQSRLHMLRLPKLEILSEEDEEEDNDSESSAASSSPPTPTYDVASPPPKTTFKAPPPTSSRRVQFREAPGPRTPPVPSSRERATYVPSLHFNPTRQHWLPRKPAVTSPRIQLNAGLE